MIWQMKLCVSSVYGLVGSGVLGIGLTSTMIPAQAIFPTATSLAQNTSPNETLAKNRPVFSGSLSLMEAVRMVRERNSSIQISAQDLAIAEAQIRSAKSARLPVVSLGVAGTLANDDFFYTTGVGPGNIPRNAAGEFNVGLSLPLYTGGRLTARVDQTLAEREATQSDLATTRLESVLMVKKAYFEALFTRSQVEVYKQYVAQREASLKNTRDLFAIGKVPRVYVLRDQTELASAKRALLAAQTVLDKAMADLKRVLGANPTSNFTLSDSFNVKTVALDLSQLLVQAKQANPELAALRSRIKVSEADMRMAKAAFLPQVNLFAQGELRTPTSPGFGNGGSLAVVANWQVLDFGGRSAEVDRALAGIRKAQLQGDEKEQDLAKMITQAWLDWQEAKAAIELTQATVAQATEENRLAQERFAVGKSIQVEVLNSSVALLRARLENLKSFYDHNVAVAQLERLTGVESQ
jgi:outer membrane protein